MSRPFRASIWYAPKSRALPWPFLLQPFRLHFRPDSNFKVLYFRNPRIRLPISLAIGRGFDVFLNSAHASAMNS